MKKIIASLGLALGTFLSATPATAAVVVSFSPSSQHVNVGDFVTVDVAISGLGSEILSAYDVNVLFNAAVLGGIQSISMNSAEFGDPDFYFGGSFGAGNNGSIGGSLLDDDDLAVVQTDGAFTFLTFGFTALTDGVSFLRFGPDLDFERNVVGRDFQTLDAAFGSACISVGTGTCQVPEPASFALVGVALAAAALAPVASRRRRSPKA